MKKYLKLRKHNFKNIEIFLVPHGTSQSLTKASSFPINLSVVRKRVCQMPGGMLMPSPRGRDKIARGGWAPLELTDALVYVIAWARGQLRINSTSIFKVFTKLPESRSDESNLENFENTSEINP